MSFLGATGGGPVSFLGATGGGPISYLGATTGGTGESVLGAAFGGRLGTLVKVSPGLGLSSTPLVIIASRFPYI